jgi:adenylate cyclase
MAQRKHQPGRPSPAGLLDSEKAGLAAPEPRADATPEARAWPVTRWMGAEAPHGEVNAMIDGFAAQLMAAGLPLARMTFHIQLINPQVSRAMREWWRGLGTVEHTRPHGVELTADYLGSPMQYVTKRRDWLVRRLDEATAAEFPILAGLRRRGLTHYVMAPMPFSDGTVNAASWASDAPGGFSDADIALLREIAPTLALLMEMRAVRRMASELMATYLGPEAGARVLAGEIRRGNTMRMQAAILLADLKDSTRYSNLHREDEMVARLNRYFDCVAPPVESRGGEVLKFVGDGMMAIFRDEPGEDGGRACCSALEAARAGLAAMEAANRGPAVDGEPPLAGRMALHHGTVAYGNIGAPDRLDFTVIGHDVNLAYRIERQGSELGLPLVMSGPFARQVAGAGALVSLGSFELRSLDMAEELFTLEEAPPETPASRG